MSIKTVEIIEQLKSLTLLETSELVKKIEDTFGVDASPQVRFTPIEVSPRGMDKPLEPPVPVQTEFDVVLEEVPADKKIAILKVIRTLTGLALKEAKDFVDSAPKVVSSRIALDVAEDIKQQLESAGAIISLK